MRGRTADASRAEVPMRLWNSISGRRALFALAAAAPALLCGTSGAEEKAAPPTFGAISLRNDGQVARHFEVGIFLKKPRGREKLAESVRVWISAGGDFAWNRALVGKSYRVHVTALPAGAVVYDQTSEVH